MLPSCNDSPANRHHKILVCGLYNCIYSALAPGSSDLHSTQTFTALLQLAADSTAVTPQTEPCTGEGGKAQKLVSCCFAGSA